MRTPWNRFFVQFQRDFRLWMFLMLAASLFRLAFIATFRAQIDPQAGGMELLAALLNGLRFDAVVSTSWLIPSLILSVACGFGDLQRAADVVRAIGAATFVVVTVVLDCVSIEYFREFDDVFNQFLFKFYEDDTAAILTTVFCQHHFLSYLALMIVLIPAGVWIQRRFFRGEFFREEAFARVASNHLRRGLLTAMILLMFIVGVRGSLSRRPVQLKDAAITSDRLLNKAVLNPQIALRFAVCDYLQTVGDAGLRSYLPDENIVRACAEAFPDTPSRRSIDGVMERIAAGPKSVPPRHIFLIFEESYDAWPMLDAYRSLRLTEQGRRLAREGLHVQAFLPAAEGSIEACIAMTAGLPSASAPARCEQAAATLTVLSLPEAMRRLGYRTRFFYGGYLSWCNVGDFARRLGFQEIYGAGHIARWSATNEWGVHDEFLFEFIRKTVHDDAPSFNFVMTCTYHPPFDVDLKKEGCPLVAVPAELREKFRQEPERLLPMLGHLWYADRCLGQFVAQAEQAWPRSLFAITGDHYGRHFINHSPTLFERSAVPLILYGKEVLRGVRLPEGVAGGHIDIPPKLVELAAPKGFPYHSFGQDLLTPQKRFLGFGTQRVIGKDFVFDLREGGQFGALPGCELPPQLPDVAGLMRLHHAIHGVAWWRVQRGAELPGPIYVANTPGTTLR